MRHVPPTVAAAVDRWNQRCRRDLAWIGEGLERMARRRRQRPRQTAEGEA